MCCSTPPHVLRQRDLESEQPPSHRPTCSPPKTVLDFFKPQKKARLEPERSASAPAGPDPPQEISLLTDGEESLPSFPQAPIEVREPLRPLTTVSSAPPASDGSQSLNNAKALAELVAMGFAAPKAEMALKVCRGNAERAANWLLSSSH